MSERKYKVTALGWHGNWTEKIVEARDSCDAVRQAERSHGAPLVRWTVEEVSE